MKMRQLPQLGWITLVLTACGHIGLDWNKRSDAVIPGDGDSDAWGGDAGRPDDAGDGDSGDGDAGDGDDQTGDGDSVHGSGGKMPGQGAGGDGLGGEDSVGTGGDDGSGGYAATGGADAGGSGGAGTGGAPQIEACQAPGDHHFGFDSSASFSLNGPLPGIWGLDTSYTLNSGNLSWTGEDGYFEAGMLKAVIVQPTAPAYPQALYPRTALERKDLRQAHLTAHVYVDSGLEVVAKIFVQSDGYLWAEGPPADLTLGVWTCLELDLREPAYADEGFDASKIVGIGVEIARSQPNVLTSAITAYLDDVSY